LIVFKLMISCLHKPWHKMACLYTPAVIRIPPFSVIGRTGAVGKTNFTCGRWSAQSSAMSAHLQMVGVQLCWEWECQCPPLACMLIYCHRFGCNG
jgi:hypothetical protein